MVLLTVPVASVDEMRAADAAAPVPVEVLIERAGRAVANAALDVLGGAYGKRIAVVAGKGNNGADGRSAARYLERRGARAAIVDPGEGDLGGADLVIDAAFGTGFRGEYKAPDPGGAPVLAVDIPSGVDGDSGAAGPDAVRADVTVTMAALKPGLLLGDGPDRTGALTVADIGLPVGQTRAALVGAADLAWLPGRSRTAHKWAQAVWVAAGSPGMRGAPGLCARAALRSGAGMLHVGTPGLAASEHPPGEAVYVDLPTDDWAAVVLGEIDRFKAVVVGPGLGATDASAAGVWSLVERSPVPVVVDADGLNVLGRVDQPFQSSAPIVLTPHDAEFARMAGSPPGTDRVGAACALAARANAVVLLKGPTTIVAAPTGEVLLAAAGDSRLATSGTGDVLAGVIGAFLAAGVEPTRAAALGAYVHGAAAMRGRASGLVAGDLPDLIPLVMP